LFLSCAAAASPAIRPLSLHDALPISSRPAAQEPASPSALASVSASKPKSFPTAAAAPNGPWTPGLWKPRVDSSPTAARFKRPDRSEEHTSELQSRENLVCRLLLEKKK